jgi:hypothetical protein
VKRIAARVTLAWMTAAALLPAAHSAHGQSAGPAAGATAAAAPKPAGAATTQPITTSGDKVAVMLRKWWSDGTAAGHVGDWYDNRDRGHSEFDRTAWPQLQKVAYTPEQLAARSDWAVQRMGLPFVVFGNSSTSAGVANGGSNVRMCYVSPSGLSFLHGQYTHNNLYIYPSHLDHNPGRNGAGAGAGYGDLYPTNTPYLIASRGSSGSDQPFLLAVCQTLAAFRPEVKNKLVATGLLMPTIQMILRSCNRNVPTKPDYLTGKAHPTVFEGSLVDGLRMARLAQDITLETLPPMVRIKVVSEEEPVNGRDFFDLPGRSEKLADTPCVIARVWRGAAGTRTMKVSAAGSADLNGRALTYEWVVLRGDRDTISIATADVGRTAGITLSYPYRRPVARGSPLESNRVDIGVFVHNGAYYSAPAFVTFYGLDDEARTYDPAGRLVEIGYGAGETALQVNWPALLGGIAKGGAAPAWGLLKENWKESEIAAIASFAAEHARLTAEAEEARAKAGELAKALAKAKADVDDQAKPAGGGEAIRRAEAELNAANTKLAKAAKAAADLMAARWDGLHVPVQKFVMGAIKELTSDPNFPRAAEAMTRTDAGRQAAPALAAAMNRLAGYGITADSKSFELRPMLADSRKPSVTAGEPAADGAGLTKYERCQLERANAEVLAALLPRGVLSASFRPYYVDTRLAAPKAWRDVFQYDVGGRIIRWTRYDGAKGQSIDPANPPPMPRGN